MTSTKRRVLKNTGAYTIVGMLPFLTSFFMLPIYTRFLTPEDYGVLSLIGAFSAMLSPIVSLQLHTALARYYFDYEGAELKRFYSTTLHSVTVVTIIFLLAVHFFGEMLTSLVFPKANISYYPFFTIALVNVFLLRISIVAQTLIVVREKGQLVLVRSIVGSVAGILLGLLFVVYLQMSVLGALLAQVAGSFITTVLNLILTRRFISLSWSKAYFNQSLNFSWPIIPHSIGGYLFMYSDRIILEKYLPLALLGLYSIAGNFAKIMKLIVNSINQAINPNFIRMARKDEKVAVLTFQKIITKWAVLISAIYLVLSFFSEEVIIVMTPNRYHAAYALIPVLLAGYIFRGLYCFAAYPLFFLKKTKYIPIITSIAGLINVGLNLVLIPKFGLIGAAYTTVFSFAITFIIAFHLSSKFFSMKFEWDKLIQIFSLMMLCTLVIFLIHGQGFIIKILIKVCICLGFVSFLWMKNYGDFKQDVFAFSNILKSQFAKKLKINLNG